MFWVRDPRRSGKGNLADNYLGWLPVPIAVGSKGELVVPCDGKDTVTAGDGDGRAGIIFAIGNEVPCCDIELVRKKCI